MQNQTETMRGPKVDVYLSKDSEAAILGMRADALKKLPFAVTELCVATTIGDAHVTVCGPKNAPPLLLWQGAHCPGPILLPSVEELVKVYRVYTADTPTHGADLMIMEVFSTLPAANLLTVLGGH
jgi:hypothetical protein